MDGFLRSYSTAEYVSRIRICGQILLSPLISDEDYRGMLWGYKQKAMEVEKSLKRKRTAYCSITTSHVEELKLPMQEIPVVNSLSEQNECNLNNEQEFSSIKNPKSSFASLDVSHTLPTASQLKHFQESNETLKDTNNNKSVYKSKCNDSNTNEDTSFARHLNETTKSPKLNNSVSSQNSPQFCGSSLERQRTFVVDVPSVALLEYMKGVGDEELMSIGQDDRSLLECTPLIFGKNHNSCLHKNGSFHLNQISSSEELSKGNYSQHTFEIIRSKEVIKRDLHLRSSSTPVIDKDYESSLFEDFPIELRNTSTSELEEPDSEKMNLYERDIPFDNQKPIHSDQVEEEAFHPSLPLTDVYPILCFPEGNSFEKTHESSCELEKLRQDYLNEQNNEIILQMMLKRLEKKQKEEIDEIMEHQKYERKLLIQYIKIYFSAAVRTRAPEQDLTPIEIAHAEKLLAALGVSLDFLQHLTDKTLSRNKQNLNDDTFISRDGILFDNSETCEDYNKDHASLAEKQLSCIGSSIVLSRESDKSEDISQKIQNAASKINAAARGYLTRRLMKSAHVKSVMELITSTVEFALQLQKDSEINLMPSDVQLHGRLISQVTAACNELYDIFFNKSVQERMLIIAADRRKRTKFPVEKGLSSATLKKIKRKQSLSLHPDSHVDGKVKEDSRSHNHSLHSELGPCHLFGRTYIVQEHVRSPPTSPSRRKALRRSSDSHD